MHDSALPMYYHTCIIYYSSYCLVVPNDPVTLSMSQVPSHPIFHNQNVCTTSYSVHFLLTVIYTYVIALLHSQEHAGMSSSRWLKGGRDMREDEGVTGSDWVSVPVRGQMRSKHARNAVCRNARNSLPALGASCYHL